MADARVVAPLRSFGGSPRLLNRCSASAFRRPRTPRQCRWMRIAARRLLTRSLATDSRRRELVILRCGVERGGWGGVR
jgi:hypothetical protein